MIPRLSSALAATPQGRTYYCSCKDGVAVHFKDRWFGFAREELPAFRDSLARLIRDPFLIRRLIREALAQGGPAESLPSPSDLGEMLDLVDASLLILEAQEIAAFAAHSKTGE